MRYRIRREAVLVFSVLIILALLLIFKPSRSNKLGTTNLGGFSIERKADGSDVIVTYAENDSYSLGSPPEILLIVNGNVVKSSNIKSMNGSSLIPVEVFSASIGAELKNIDSTNDEYIITKGDTKVTFKLDEQSADISGKSTFLDIVPTRDGKFAYIPLKQFYEIFQYKVLYSDGSVDKEVYPTIPGFQQIMVYKYPENIKSIEEKDAMDYFIGHMKKAYKSNFKSTWKEPDESETPPEYKEGYATNRQETMRFFIRDVKNIHSETDRYFVFGDNINFLLDKYTKDIYVIYKKGANEGVTFKLFDPSDKNSLN